MVRNAVLFADAAIAIATMMNDGLSGCNVHKILQIKALRNLFAFVCAASVTSGQ